MKVVILAGGYGTRISEGQDSVPKPMLEVNGKPILWYIMYHYSLYGFKDFIVACGYKAKSIKEYFVNYNTFNFDLEIDLKNNSNKIINKSKNLDWNIKLIDTGLDALTGTRIKKLQNHINEDSFLLTYGDGISNVNIEKLIKFHKRSKKLITMTVVRPKARFGEIVEKKGVIKSFQEKPDLNNGLINAGFFVINKEVFKYIPKKNCMFEREPLQKIVEKKQAAAYLHNEFWQCIDTRRELNAMNELFQKKSYDKILNKNK